MSTNFEPAGPNYLIGISDDSANHEIEITNTDYMGSAWQISNLDTGNTVYVRLGFQALDSPAIVPEEGTPGFGTAVLPESMVTVSVNTRAGAGAIGAPGILYVSGAVDGTANVVLVPGRMIST